MKTVSNPRFLFSTLSILALVFSSCGKSSSFSKITGNSQASPTEINKVLPADTSKVVAECYMKEPVPTEFESPGVYQLLIIAETPDAETYTARMKRYTPDYTQPPYREPVTLYGTTRRDNTTSVSYRRLSRNSLDSGFVADISIEPIKETPEFHEAKFHLFRMISGYGPAPFTSLGRCKLY